MIHKFDKYIVGENVASFVLHKEESCLFEDRRHTSFLKPVPKYIMNHGNILRHENMYSLISYLTTLITKSFQHNLICKHNFSHIVKISINNSYSYCIKSNQYWVLIKLMLELLVVYHLFGIHITYCNISQWKLIK